MSDRPQAKPSSPPRKRAPVDHRPRRDGRRPALGRADVVRAALEVVARDGPGALGVNAVARALGIKPPSLYNHVDGNDALERAVALEGWRRLGGALAGRRRAPDPRAELAAMCRRFRDFVRANGALYAVMAATALDPGDAECQAVIAALLGEFERVLAPLGITGADAIHAIRGLRAALHGFVTLELGGQFGLPQAINESFRRLTASLIAGLGPG